LHRYLLRAVWLPPVPPLQRIAGICKAYQSTPIGFSPLYYAAEIKMVSSVRHFDKVGLPLCPIINVKALAQGGYPAWGQLYMSMFCSSSISS
jgi:hypothetical protein